MKFGTTLNLIFYLIMKVAMWQHLRIADYMLKQFWENRVYENVDYELQ